MTRKVYNSILNTGLGIAVGVLIATTLGMVFHNHSLAFSLICLFLSILSFVGVITVTAIRTIKGTQD